VASPGEIVSTPRGTGESSVHVRWQSEVFIIIATKKGRGWYNVLSKRGRGSDEEGTNTISLLKGGKTPRHDAI